MNLYDFCLKLETLGMLTDGVKVGAISPVSATWYKMMKDYKEEKKKPGFKQSETLHRLSVKYGLAYHSCYKIVSKFT